MSSQKMETRKVVAVIAFVIVLGGEALVGWNVVKPFSDILGDWFDAAPLLLIGIVGLLLTWPIVAYQYIFSGGRKIGEEAEDVARGMNS